MRETLSKDDFFNYSYYCECLKKENLTELEKLKNSKEINNTEKEIVKKIIKDFLYNLEILDDIISENSEIKNIVLNVKKAFLTRVNETIKILKILPIKEKAVRDVIFERLSHEINILKINIKKISLLKEYNEKKYDLDEEKNSKKITYLDYEKKLDTLDSCYNKEYCRHQISEFEEKRAILESRTKFIEVLRRLFLLIEIQKKEEELEELKKRNISLKNYLQNVYDQDNVIGLYDQDTFENQVKAKEEELIKLQKDLLDLEEYLKDPENFKDENSEIVREIKDYKKTIQEGIEKINREISELRKYLRESFVEIYEPSETWIEEKDNIYYLPRSKISREIPAIQDGKNYTIIDAKPQSQENSQDEYDEEIITRDITIDPINTVKFQNINTNQVIADFACFDSEGKTISGFENVSKEAWINTSEYHNNPENENENYFKSKNFKTAVESKELLDLDELKSKKVQSLGCAVVTPSKDQDNQTKQTIDCFLTDGVRIKIIIEDKFTGKIKNLYLLPGRGKQLFSMRNGEMIEESADNYPNIVINEPLYFNTAEKFISNFQENEVENNLSDNEKNKKAKNEDLFIHESANKSHVQRLLERQRQQETHITHTI